MTNCPNCGAPIDQYRYVKCPHCGTDYYDFAPMEIGRPFFMKFKHDNQTMIAKVILTQFNISEMPSINDLYADNIKMISACYDTDIQIDISMAVVNQPENNNRRWLVVDGNKEY